MNEHRYAASVEPRSNPIPPQASPPVLSTFQGSEVPQQAPMTKEEFLAIVERITAMFAGGCTVHGDAPGYTLDEQVRRREQESRVAVRRAGQARDGR
jgi:hypothetical protein